VVSSVKCNADEKQNDGKHDDASENFHGYSFPIWSMRRSTWRCKRKMPKPMLQVRASYAARIPQGQLWRSALECAF
jgi:hypothetical protein